MQLLDESFGGLEKFQAAFKAAAVGQFGSGWAWLVSKGGKLAIETTSNADTPLAHGGTALLVADVWEHAYYLDFQNRRPDHVQAWMEKLINWAWVEENLG
jgi:Fe-Mn family superoxide dismutase